jgi:hypothetical protein
MSTNVKAGDTEPIGKRGPAMVLDLRMIAPTGPRGRVAETTSHR